MKKEMRRFDKINAIKTNLINSKSWGCDSNGNYQHFDNLSNKENHLNVDVRMKFTAQKLRYEQKIDEKWKLIFSDTLMNIFDSMTINTIIFNKKHTFYI